MTEEEVSQQTLARVDERTKSIQNDISQLRDDLKGSMIGLSDKIKDVEMRFNVKLVEAHAEITNIYTTLDREYTKKADSGPVHKLVYGFVGLLVTGVIVALLSTVIKTNTFQTQLPSISTGK